MSRHRWMRAVWPISIRAVSRKLKELSFSEGRIEGFVVDRVRENYLQARYIERFTYVENLVDPFGREEVFERTEYRQCEFIITENSPGLELLNPPRSIQGMISKFTEITDFSMSLSPVSVDVMKWSSAFQHVFGNVIVDSLQIGALILEPGISAKAVLKGERDIVKAALNFTKGKSCSIEKIQLRTEGRGSILLTSSAVAKIDSDNSDEILEVVRKSLVQVL